jgi:hypothetical protein
MMISLSPYRHHSNYTYHRLPQLLARGMPAGVWNSGHGRPSGVTQTNTVLTYKGILAQQ